MRMLIGALTLGVLAGCTAPAMNEARSQGPYKTFLSQKSGQLVAQCIQFAWQDESVFGVEGDAFIHSGSQNKLTVYTRGSEYFVDVLGGASGTTVNYYQTLSNSIAERRLSALATCL
jgi:hypothetical protein